MRRGIVWTSVGAGASADVGRRVAVSGEIEHARLTGATPNARTGGSGSLSWRAPAVLALATTVRAFGYAVDPGEGYFAPRQYVLAEMSAQLAIRRALGWSVTLDGDGGVQKIDTHARIDHATGDARWTVGPLPASAWPRVGRLRHDRERAAPATSTLSSYQATGVGLKGRVSF